ncbi:MAG: TetR/AcrR family transcriptional regulator [Niastella sp.]|nr:TetR/AcrR family transcriptional regulator [Niastella sp.]
MEIKERQLEIITAAGEILTEHGLAQLTTKRLASKMGFSESALYRHFSSKEEILVTMLQYLASDMDNRLKQSLQHVEAPDLHLKTVLGNQFDFFKRNPHFLVAIFSEGLMEDSEIVKESILQIMHIKKFHLHKIIKKGQADGTFTKELTADELVHIIMGSFRLHLLQWWFSGQSFDVKQKGEKLINNLLTLIKLKK